LKLVEYESKDALPLSHGRVKGVSKGKRRHWITFHESKNLCLEPMIHGVYPRVSDRMELQVNL